MRFTRGSLPFTLGSLPRRVNLHGGSLFPLVMTVNLVNLSLLLLYRIYSPIFIPRVGCRGSLGSLGSLSGFCGGSDVMDVNERWGVDGSRGGVGVTWRGNCTEKI